MRHYVIVDCADTNPRPLLDIPLWVDCTDDEFDRLPDLKVGDSINLASGEVLKRVE